MGQLVLLVVAAAWAAVLVPPLLRSRIENRPELVGHRLRQPAVQPAAGDAVRAASPCVRWLARWRRRRSAARPPPAGRRCARVCAPTARRPRRPHARRPRRSSIAPACTTPRRGRAATASAVRRPLPRSRQRRQAPPRQRAVRARPDRRLLAVPRRHDEGAGVAVVLVRRVRRAVRLRLRARPVAPA